MAYSWHEYDNKSCFNHSVVLYRRYFGAAPLTITSSSLSIIGCLLIMYTYLRWKDVRQSTARVILFWLAVSDLLSSISYLVATLFHYVYPLIRKATYYNICTAMSVLTTYFPKTAILWTIFLAIYFVLTLVFKWGRPNQRKCKRLMVVAHLTAWCLPLLVVIPALLSGWLGHGEATQGSTWCFIAETVFRKKPVDEFERYMLIYFIMEAVCGWMWDVGAIGCVVVCYVLIISCNRCRWRKQRGTYVTERISSALAGLDFKLMLVPLLFILLRVWGIIRYLVSVVPGCQKPRLLHNSTTLMAGFCITDDCPVVYNTFLICIQAFAFPLQGFVNAVLFVLLSKVIICRLLSNSLCCRKSKINTGEAKLLPDTDEDRRPLLAVTWRSKRQDTPGTSRVVSGDKYGAMLVHTKQNTAAKLVN